MVITHKGYGRRHCDFKTVYFFCRRKLAAESAKLKHALKNLKNEVNTGSDDENDGTKFEAGAGGAQQPSQSIKMDHKVTIKKQVGPIFFFFFFLILNT